MKIKLFAKILPSITVIATLPLTIISCENKESKNTLSLLNQNLLNLTNSLEYKLIYIKNNLTFNSGNMNPFNLYESKVSTNEKQLLEFIINDFFKNFITTEEIYGKNVFNSNNSNINLNNLVKYIQTYSKSSEYLKNTFLENNSTLSKLIETIDLIVKDLRTQLINNSNKISSFLNSSNLSYSLILKNKNKILNNDLPLMQNWIIFLNNDLKFLKETLINDNMLISISENNIEDFDYSKIINHNHSHANANMLQLTIVLVKILQNYLNNSENQKEIIINNIKQNKIDNDNDFNNFQNNIELFFTKIENIKELKILNLNNLLTAYSQNYNEILNILENFINILNIDKNNIEK
ncbi:MAG5150 family histidine triad lipoprotein [Mycoplasma sp. 1018B]|uniref:MAG5150 family histidine triad lipoprotein n=1 Tax=Mycoplasma sp. 1018B TaxID=2967302 RepID=UPI00211C9E7D|nr:hypothetical protein [Mycoplasma sp. 1018B]UUM19045.1 hypothetical protein NPA14_01745 [Mycoplasma sp. 1018B]